MSTCSYEGCSKPTIDMLAYCPEHREHGLHSSPPCQEQGCSGTSHEAMKCGRCGKLFCRFHLEDNHDGCRIPG